MKRVALLTLLSAACGTMAEGDGGGENLPDRGIVPFDKLEPPEDDDTSILPFVLADSSLDYDEPTVLISGERVDVYFQADGEGRSVVKRALSDNGADFTVLETILEPELSWEEEWVGAPTALRSGGEISLFYLGGIEQPAVGLARSSDGTTWVREQEPVFAPNRVIGSPSVVTIGSRLVMFHAVFTEAEEEDTLIPTEIAYATSIDGVSWNEMGRALTTGTGCVSDAGSEVRCWDETYVTSPGVRVSQTSTGRTIVDLWYTGGVADNSNIGIAAAFADLSFERYALNPILDDRGPEAAAFVVPYKDRLLMYYSDEHDGRRAIALAVNDK